MAVSYPHESLVDSHQDGCAEPYIAEAICALLKAKGGIPVVLETGGFIGTTSAWIALTLHGMGGGYLHVSEIDPDRAKTISDRIYALDIGDTVAATMWNEDVMQTIERMPSRGIDVVWVDDDHSRLHVEQEINALWPKMKPGGLMLFHDVSSDGVCQLGPLIRKWGGIALDLPKLGPDGGLGLIQIPNV